MRTSSLFLAGEGRNHRFEKRMYCYISFSGETKGLNARLVYFALLSACFALSLFLFCFREIEVMTTLPRAEKTTISMGLEKRANGCGNQVDEERNRRASNLLPINRLKINSSRFDSDAMRWG